MKKTALVTGGNSGIGFATAKLLKDKNYNVTICGRNEKRVKVAAESLEVNYTVCDMGNVEQVGLLAERFLNEPLNVLVNNAGIAKFIPLAMYSENDFYESFNVNVRGPFELIKQLLPALEKAQGSVTNVSSAVVNNGLPNAALYAATKGALDAMTKSMALELAPQNIRINAVSPGAIDTPIIHKLGLDESIIGAMKEQVKSTIPLKRYGNPEEVAEVIVAQLESSYTTGAIWPVDGGVNAY